MGAAPGGPAVAASWVERIGPLSALAVSLLAVVGSLFVRDWRVGAVTLAAVLVLVVGVVRRPRVFVRRLAPGLLAALSVGFSSWLLGDRDPATGLTAALRILVLVLPGIALVERLDPSALGDALAQRLRLPGRPVVASVAALQRLESLGEDWAQLDRARRARGLGPGRSPVSRLGHAAALTFGLLVSGLRRSTRMAVAMDARGFATARRRSWAEPSPWTGADSVLVAAGAVLAALPAVLSAVL